MEGSQTNQNQSLQGNSNQTGHSSLFSAPDHMLCLCKSSLPGAPKLKLRGYDTREAVSLHVTTEPPRSKCQRLPASRSLSKHIYLGHQEGQP